MGYLAGTVCYADYAAWLDGSLSVQPAVYTPGATNYEVFFRKDATLGWQLCRAQVSGTAVRSGQACGAVPFVEASVPQCNAAGAVVDGAVVGFAVAACVVVAWGAGVIARQLR